MAEDIFKQMFPELYKPKTFDINEQATGTSQDQGVDLLKIFNLEPVNKQQTQMPAFLDEGEEEPTPGQKVGESVFGTLKDGFDWVTDQLSETRFFENWAESLNEKEADGRAATQDYFMPELLANFEELGKSVGRGTATVLDTFVAAPLNFITRATIGEGNVLGDFVGDFADTMYKTYTSARSQAVAEQEFGREKLLNPDFYMTSVMETIPLTLSFMKIGTAAHGSLTKFLGTSKAAKILSATGGGIGMRVFESMAESEQTYEAAIEKGMTKEDALQASSQLFWRNLALFGVDAVQLALAVAPFKLNALTSQIIKETGKLAAAGVTEGFEEMYQNAEQNRALGETVDYFSPESLESGFIGAMSGIVFQGGGRISVKQAEEANEKIMDEVASYFTPEEYQNYLTRSNGGIPDVVTYRNEEGEKFFTRMTPQEYQLYQDGDNVVPAAEEGQNQIVVETYSARLRDEATEVSREEFVDNSNSRANEFINKEDSLPPINRYQLKEEAFELVGKTNPDMVEEAKIAAEANYQTRIQKVKEIFNKTEEYLKEAVARGDISIGLAIRDISNEIEKANNPVAKLQLIRAKETLLKENIQNNPARNMLKYVAPGRFQFSLTELYNHAKQDFDERGIRSKYLNILEDAKAAGYRDVKHADRGVNLYRRQKAELSGVQEERREQARLAKLAKDGKTAKRPLKGTLVAKKKQAANKRLSEEEKVLLRIAKENKQQADERNRREMARRKAHDERIKAIGLRQGNVLGKRSQRAVEREKVLTDKETRKKIKGYIKEFIPKSQQEKASNVLKNNNRLNDDHFIKLYNQTEQYIEKDKKVQAREIIKQEKLAQKIRKGVEKLSKEEARKAEIATIRLMRGEYKKARQENQGRREVVSKLLKFLEKKKLMKSSKLQRLTNILSKDSVTEKQVSKAYKEANKVLKEYEIAILKAEVKRIYKKVIGAPGVSIEYRAQLEELVPFMGKKALREEGMGLKKALEKAAKDPIKSKTMYVPERLMNVLEKSSKKPLDEMNVRELQALKSEMSRLEALGRFKQKRLDSINNLQKDIILKAVAQDTVPIESRFLEHLDVWEIPKLGKKIGNQWNRIINMSHRVGDALTIPDVFFDWLDGSYGTYDGANTRFFKDRIDMDWSDYLDYKDDWEQRLEALLDKNGLSSNSQSWKKIGWWAVYHQQGSSSKGKEKIMSLGYSEERINEILKEGLTKEEMNVYEGMQKMLEEMFPDVKKVMADEFNQDVKYVKNYFPFDVDIEAMREFGLWDKDPARVQMRLGPDVPTLVDQGKLRTKKVPQKQTKSRKGSDAPVELNAFVVMMHYIDNTAYLVKMARSVRQLSEVANSKEYQALVGDRGAKYVTRWLNDLAKKGGVGVEWRFLDGLRKNVGAGILALKITAAVIQPTAIIDGMHMTGVGNGLWGVTKWLHLRTYREFVRLFPEIRDRVGGELAIKELNRDKFWQRWQNNGYFALKALDSFAAGAVVLGAYHKRMNQLKLPVELVEGRDYTVDEDGDFDWVRGEDGHPVALNRDAMKYAQRVVRLTQASAQLKDLPPSLAHGGLTGFRSLDRALLQFQNFLIGARWNRIRHMVRVSNATRKRGGGFVETVKPTANVAAFTLAATIAATMSRQMYYMALDAIWGGDDDEWDEQVLRSFMQEALGNVPFAGNFMAMTMYDADMFPVADVIGDLTTGISDFNRATTEEARDKAAVRTAGALMTLSGVIGAKQAEQLFLEHLKSQGDDLDLDLNLDLELELELELDLDL